MAADEAHRAFLEDFMRHRQFFKTIMTHERTLTQAWIVHVLCDLVNVVVGFYCLEYEQIDFRRYRLAKAGRAVDRKRRGE